MDSDLSYSRLNGPSQSKKWRWAVYSAVTATILTLIWMSQGYVSSNNPFGSSNNNSLRKRVSNARMKSLAPIFNTTLGFEKIVGINLPSKANRKRETSLAAAVSGFQIEWMDAVRGDNITDEGLPPDHAEFLNSGEIGCWSSHMNVLHRVIENNWTTTLVLEDDADWDVRLKDLLQNFALASDIVLDPPKEAALEADFDDLLFTRVPKTSPYGDGWDVLWLGHSGGLFSENSTRVMQYNDSSVPEMHHMIYTTDPRPQLRQYPNHTRVVSRLEHSQGTQGYAVSQAGARRLLSILGLTRLDSQIDQMLRQWCDGTHGHEPHVCVGTSPELFAQHRRAGLLSAGSDTLPKKEGSRKIAFSTNIRWSVKRNMQKLLKGETDYEDQWPDKALGIPNVLGWGV